MMLLCRFSDGQILKAEAVPVLIPSIQGVQFFAHHRFDDKGEIDETLWMLSEWLTGRLVSRDDEACQTIEDACSVFERRVQLHTRSEAIRLQIKRALRIDKVALNKSIAPCKPAWLWI